MENIYINFYFVFVDGYIFFKYYDYKSNQNYYVIKYKGYYKYYDYNFLKLMR